MALEVTGKLIQLLPAQGGTSSRGNWSKQEFILETQEQFPKKVCISLWGDKVKDLDGVQLGDTITVSVNIESREFNGRWYTDVRAWRIQHGAGSATPSPASGANVPPPPADDPFLSSSDDQSTDDLPF